MKRIQILLAAALILISCEQKQPKQYDDNKVIYNVDSTSVYAKDKFHYEVDIPTRGIKASIQIENKSDTNRVFEIRVIEK